MSQKQGVLYIAAGKKYIHAAIRSAKSVIKNCPGLPTHLFADWQNYKDFNFDQDPFPFTGVEKILDPHRRSKLDYLSHTPFEQTLYLDTDTKLNADIRGMFGILDRFDIGLVHAHHRYDQFRTMTWRIDIPSAFPQFNGGVILYRRNPMVDQFLDDWQKSFSEAGYKQDQITLRELLWLNDLRIATLPPEYNVRFLKYHFLWSKSEAQTKIFHLQLYHDGPFWFLKNWTMKVGRRILIMAGIHPIRLKKDGT